MESSDVLTYDKRKPPITRVYTRKQRVREAIVLDRPSSANYPTDTIHPRGARSRDANQGDMTLGATDTIHPRDTRSIDANQGDMALGAETHPLGPRSASQEGATVEKGRITFGAKQHQIWSSYK